MKRIMLGLTTIFLIANSTTAWAVSLDAQKYLETGKRSVERAEVRWSLLEAASEINKSELSSAEDKQYARQLKVMAENLVGDEALVTVEEMAIVNELVEEAPDEGSGSGFVLLIMIFIFLIAMALCVLKNS